MAWNHAATLFTVWRDLFLTSSFVSHQRNVMADLIIDRKKLSQAITSTAESGKPEGELECTPRDVPLVSLNYGGRPTASFFHSLPQKEFQFL
jgi:hypothetical protein